MINKTPDVVDLLDELGAARNEAEQTKLALNQAILDLDIAAKQLELVYRSTSWRVTAPVRSIRRFMPGLPPLRTRARLATSKRALNLILFALKQWRLTDLLQRTIAIVRFGGWRALRQKLTQTEHMAQFIAAGTARPQIANDVTPPKAISICHSDVRAKEPSGPSYLSETYSLSGERWDRDLDTRLAARLGLATAEPAQRGEPVSDAPRCWLLVTAEGSVECEASHLAKIEATLESVAGMTPARTLVFGLVVIASATATAHLRVALATQDVPCNVFAGSLRDALADIADHDMVMFLRAGDCVRPEFAPAAARFTLRDRKIALLDLFVRDADVVFPLLLPGINVLHALNCDYFRSRFVARADVVRSVLGRSGDTRPYDVAVAILQDIYAREQWDDVVHVDLPLIEIGEPMDVLRAERARLVSERPDAVFPTPQGAAISSVTTDPASLGKVSVVICTKDKGILLRQVVSSLLNFQTHLLAEIIIVSNHTTNQHALRSLADLRAHAQVTVLEYNASFNFSAQSNLGARYATGEFLLFLNDDIVPTCDEWLGKLMLPFANPRTGITAPLLIYPDERVQHAGMYLGYKNVAGHTLRHALLPDQDYMFLATAPRFVSVATGAALLMRSSVFGSVNGFDTTFATYIQDIDLCMRVGDLGYDIVLNPLSVLIHMESPSVKAIIHDDLFHQTRATEFEIFSMRWGNARYNDPFHNANFSIDDETLHRLS